MPMRDKFLRLFAQHHPSLTQLDHGGLQTTRGPRRAQQTWTHREKHNRVLRTND